MRLALSPSFQETNGFDTQQFNYHNKPLSIVADRYIRMNIIDFEVSLAEMVVVLGAAISVDAFAPRPWCMR
jgi:hypothetical protein